MTQKVLFKQAAMLFCMAALMASCAQSDTESDVTHTGKGVTLTAIASTSTEPETRLGYQDNTTSMSFTWADNGGAKETFSALVQDGGATPVTFTQTNAGGTNNGSFSGNFGVTPGTGQALYAIYPALPATRSSQTAISLDLSRQTLAATADGLNHNKLHYMWAKTTYEGSSEVDFQFAHKVAIVKVEMTLPADAGAIKQVNFIGLHAKAHLDATSGAIDFTGITEQESMIENVAGIAQTDHKLTAYLFVFGQDATGKILKLTATDAAGKLYRVDFTGRDLVAGKVYTLKKELKVVPSGIQSWEGTITDVTSEGEGEGDSFGPGDLKIGDYYYSDGATSDGGLRELNSDGTYRMEDIKPVLSNGRTVLGIVMKVGRDGDGDWADTDEYMQKDGKTPMSTIHGYVLALDDANNGEKCQWGSYGTIVGTNTERYTGFYGYTNTNTIKAFATKNGNDLETAFPATYYVTEGYEKTNPAPDNTSGWFLPSAGQCQFWLDNKAVLQESVRKATGNDGYNWKYYYWSSSEYGVIPADYAWYLYFSLSYVDRNFKDRNFYVRSVLAF